MDIGKTIRTARNVSATSMVQKRIQIVFKQTVNVNVNQASLDIIVILAYLDTMEM